MVHSFHLRQEAVAAAVAWLLLLALAGMAEGQTLRGPDLGLWFRHERDTSGASVLVVDRLLEDGPFAMAGLRAGDRIVSVDGQPIDREPQFVPAVMKSSNGANVVNVVVTRSVVTRSDGSSNALNNTGEQATISLKTRDVWKSVVAADPFYQAGFLVDESDMDKASADKSLAGESLGNKRDRDGVVIARVFPLTPAFYAGLRQGDTITSVKGQSVTSAADVAEFLRIGGSLIFGVTRGDESRKLQIVLPRRTVTGTQYPPASRVQPPPPQVRSLDPPPPLFIPREIPSPRPRIPPTGQRPPF